MRRLIYVMSCLLMGACVEFIPVMSPKDFVLVKVDVTSGSGTRSSICPDDDKINDLLLVVYGRGRLHSVHALGGSGLSDLNLYAGEVYSFYALANAGTVSPDLFESDFIESFSFHTADLNAMEAGVPMAGMTGPVMINKGMEPVCIKLQIL